MNGRVRVARSGSISIGAELLMPSPALGGSELNTAASPTVPPRDAWRQVEPVVGLGEPEDMNEFDPRPRSPYMAGLGRRADDFTRTAEAYMAENGLLSPSTRNGREAKSEGGFTPPSSSSPGERFSPRSQSASAAQRAFALRRAKDEGGAESLRLASAAASLPERHYTPVGVRPSSAASALQEFALRHVKEEEEADALRLASAAAANAATSAAHRDPLSPRSRARTAIRSAPGTTTRALLAQQNASLRGENESLQERLAAIRTDVRSVYAGAMATGAKEVAALQREHEVVVQALHGDLVSMGVEVTRAHERVAQLVAEGDSHCKGCHAKCAMLEDRVREQSDIIHGLSETSEHLQENVASSGARWEDEIRALRERLAESETQKAALRKVLDRALAAAKDTRALLPDALAEARVEWEAERAENYQFEVNCAAASAAGAFASEHTDALHAQHEVEDAHRVELDALKDRLQREADARVAAQTAEHTLAIQEHLDARALDAERAIAAQQTFEARMDTAVAATAKVLTAQHAATIEAASAADARHFSAVATLESRLQAAAATADGQDLIDAVHANKATAISVVAALRAQAIKANAAGGPAARAPPLDSTPAQFITPSKSGTTSPISESPAVLMAALEMADAQVATLERAQAEDAAAAEELRVEVAATHRVEIARAAQEHSMHVRAHAEEVRTELASAHAGVLRESNEAQDRALRTILSANAEALDVVRSEMAAEVETARRDAAAAQQRAVNADAEGVDESEAASSRAQVEEALRRSEEVHREEAAGQRTAHERARAAMEIDNARVVEALRSEIAALRQSRIEEDEAAQASAAAEQLRIIAVEARAAADTAAVAQARLSAEATTEDVAAAYEALHAAEQQAELDADGESSSLPLHFMRILFTI